MGKVVLIFLPINSSAGLIPVDEVGVALYVVRARRGFFCLNIDLIELPSLPARYSGGSEGWM